MKLAAILISLCASVHGAIYYVDFGSGSDSNNGTATNAPWQHCPGDANATGTAAAATLAAGDSVLFKGGTTYRGSISVNWSGSAGSRISYIGNQWGTPNALMDGSTVVTSAWTACVSQNDCGGNPYWTNIWWIPVPTGISNCLPQMFINGTNFSQWSQDPTPSDPIFWETLSQFRTCQATNINRTNIIDSINLTNSDSAFFNESWAGVWVQGNAIELNLITNYNVATHTITTAIPRTHDVNGNLDNAFPGQYVIIGNLAYVDSPGEWAVRTNENRLYYWPNGSINPNTATVSIGGGSGSAFHDLGSANINVSGFVCRGYYEPPGVAGYNQMFFSSGSSGKTANNITVSSNEIYFMRSFNAGPVINMDGGTNYQVINNYIHDLTLSRGLLMGYSNHVISGNVISRLNGTAIYCANVQFSTVNSNTILDLHGIHGNGISVYQSSTNVTVSGNIISNCLLAITSQTSSGLRFFNNLIDVNAGTDSTQVQVDYDYYGTVFVNNTFAGIPASPVTIGFVRGTTGTTITNAWDGVTNIFENNIFWGYPQGQKNILLFYNGNLDPGGSMKSTYWTNNIYTNSANVFSNPSAHNWSLNPNGLAVNAGRDESAFTTVDIIGATRPQGSAWDIGAYEYVAPASGVTINISGNLSVGTIKGP